MEAYCRDVSKIPLLTPEEEYELGMKAKAGDKEAKKKLIEANLRLVISVAKRYYYKGLDYDDLIQEGNYGLMVAAEKFDPELGYKFSTLATWWIRQAMTRGTYSNSRTIRLPEYLASKFSKVISAEQKLMQLTYREPSSEEIAKEAKVPERTVQAVMRFADEVDSLDVEREFSNSELIDLIADEGVDVESQALQNTGIEEMIDIMRSIKGIKERNLKLFLLKEGIFDGEKMTFEEVGKLFGVNKKRACKICKRILELIRDSKKATRRLTEFGYVEESQTKIRS